VSGRAAGLAVLVAAAGCGSPAPAPTGTGAKEAAQGFFEAVAAKDWARAYAGLSAESKARVGAEAFARLGEAYHRGVGFEPTTVRVTACDENGDAAVAHVTLSGPGSGRHRFKDPVALRRTGGTWLVVLPASFGRAGES